MNTTINIRITCLEKKERCNEIKCNKIQSNNNKKRSRYDNNHQIKCLKRKKKCYFVETIAKRCKKVVNDVES